jgi:hypothetical protein
MKSLLGKLGVVLIGLIIFTCAEVWGAESAWVLWFRYNFETYWAKDQIDKDGKVIATKGYMNDFFLRTWEVVDAFPTYGQCQKVMKEKIEYERKWFGDDFDYTKSDVFKDYDFNILLKQQSFIDKDSFQLNSYRKDGSYDKRYWKWKCLPETIDPRK